MSKPHHGRFNTHSRSAASSFPLRLLCTPLRSHLASGLAAIVLIAVIAWIWCHPQTLATDHSHTQEQIDDAINLISSRERLQNRFNEATTKQNEFHQRMDAIAGWLPEKRSWESVRQSLQAVAASADVQLIGLDRGASHHGTRVAVIDARCEIQGSYPGICEFMQQLVMMEAPIWCDEVRIVRGDENELLDRDKANESDGSVLCLATLSLRAPFAGSETAAGKLLQRRPNDAG